jgi:hypothetical protein
MAEGYQGYEFFLIHCLLPSARARRHGRRMHLETYGANVKIDLKIHLVLTGDCPILLMTHSSCMAKVRPASG